jgi:hypothetical protein
MPKSYTIEEVKEKLPSVRVIIGTKVAKGRVVGRKNKFATVHTRLGSYEFSWLAITRAINGNYALIAQ